MSLNMHITRRNQRPLQDAGVPGIERGRVWNRGHGVAVEFCRMKRGALYGKHPHASWEQMFVVEGAICVDGEVLIAGDFAFTEPGESHEVSAVEDSVVLLSFGQPAK
jgi:quercetin dioxygenase-like cupin family protein